MTLTFTKATKPARQVTPEASKEGGSMSGFTFTDATSEGIHARIALAGPSGSGKTWTALALATELAQGGLIGVVDTERRSASKYRRHFTFKTLNLTSFEPDKLVEVLASAADQGIAVIIVDSLSHFWFGEGGMLQQVDHAAKRAQGNSFAGWKTARPMELRMLNALLAFPGHVIVTMRTKTEWVTEKDPRTGKSAPRKVGLKPEQRDGIEYEFDLVGDLDADNTLVISKSRITPLANRVIEKPGGDMATEILEWLNDDADEPAFDATMIRDRAIADDATAAELRVLWEDANRRQLLGSAVKFGNATLTLGELLQERGKALAEAKA